MKAAQHKLPGKSSSNVCSVCLVYHDDYGDLDDHDPDHGDQNDHADRVYSLVEA